MSLTLVIANRNYSSWSMRAWLVMRHFEFDFEEVVIPLDQEDTRERILVYSPSGRLPCLMDEGLPVWDSLAIIELLAEKAPKQAIWPVKPRARAMARSISAEMHAGFWALRRACPMNLRKTFEFRKWGGAEAAADVRRIQQLWAQALELFGGPFLFGEFSAADAMYAPVVTRLRGYGWQVTKENDAYMRAVEELPAFREWCEDAQREKWVIPADEVEAA